MSDLPKLAAETAQRMQGRCNGSTDAAVILAAMTRVSEEHEDKAIVDWLEKHNPYKWVNTHVGQTWRSKVRAAMKETK